MVSFIRKLFQTLEDLQCNIGKDGSKIPVDSGLNAKVKMPEKAYAVLTSRRNGEEVKKVYGPKKK